MKYKTRLRNIILLLIVFQGAGFCLRPGWDSVAVILERIRPPVFPDNEFNILSFGAAGNGTTDCSAAINNAIVQCSTSGGGRVLIPAGNFLTGAVRMRSNVNLVVSLGATLLFTKDKSKYLPVVYTRFEGVECMNYSPFIYAYGDSNLAVSGGGIIDGQADNTTWWDWKQLYYQDTSLLAGYARNNTPVQERIFGQGHYLRPNFIQFYHCKNILIEGVTLKRSPMWEVHPVLSTNITIRNISVDTNGPNNDGCNPESCTDVLITNCFFNTGDDCIAIKSGRNEDGRRVNVPSRNIVIKGCTFQNGHGGVTMGSEMSGGIRNVYADSCVMLSSVLYSMLRLKTNSLRGGYIENVFARNISVANSTRGTVDIDMYYGEGDVGPYTPVIRNITVENITSTRSMYAFYFKDLPRSPIANVEFSNCTFNNVSSSYLRGNVQNLILRNVRINGALISSAGKESSTDANEHILPQNYPNPFNPSTVIPFTVMPVSGDRAVFVSLRVYDALGRVVAEPVRGYLLPGRYEENFNAAGFSGGVYYYTLRSGSRSVTGKMMLLR